MSVGLLIAAGIAFEVLLAVYVVVLTQMEQKALAELVRDADGDLLAAVEDLPPPYKVIARPFADQLAMDQDMDDALVDVVVDTTRQPFKKPLAARLAVGVVASVICLAPASYGLFRTASDIVTAWGEAKSLDRALVYLKGQTELEGPFSMLRNAFHGSALLFFGLAFLWALTWYLRRPEVREARFIRAMLEAAAKASPGTAAPVAGRLAELIAPDRGLNRPITAMVVCLVGITAGWFVLYQTADVRAANDREPVFDVWPGNARPVQVRAEISLPIYRAGAPLAEGLPPSLIIGTRSASIQGIPMAELVERELREGWRQEVPSLRRTLEQARGRVMVIGHRETPVSVLLDLLDFVAAEYAITDADLLLERTVKTGAPGGRAVQAALPLEIRSSDRPAALRLEMADAGIRILPSAKLLPYEGSAWRGALQRAVRERPELLRNERRAVVEVVPVSRLVAYDRLVQILATADTACVGAGDCGLPGLGLIFRLAPGTNPAAPNP